MFIGHFALGFAAKKMDNRPSLGTTLMAAQFVDLLWPFFLIFGIETVKIEPGNTVFTPLNFTHYPWSHSLTGAISWGILFGVIYYLFTRNGKVASLLGLLVISHWVLDFLTHRPDLPLTFSENEKVGLELWNYKLLTLITESVMFIAGIFLYIKSTKAINPKGNILLWSFFIVTYALYLTSAFSPPPPSAIAIAYTGIGQWLFIAWAYWIDKNRTRKLTTG